MNNSLDGLNIVGNIVQLRSFIESDISDNYIFRFISYVLTTSVQIFKQADRSTE